MRPHGGTLWQQRMRVCAATLALLSVLTGCAQAYPIPRAPQGNPIDAARALSDAPEEVRNGDAANTCGEFALDQGDGVPTEAVDCLSTALASQQEAELAWTLPTTEGDPLVYFAFVGGGNDEVTVITTNAFDSYGGDPTWTSTSCADVRVATSWAGCANP